MKCLSLTQPWATLVVTGAKQWDTRSWRTSYRGPLLVHAARRFPPEAQRFARLTRERFARLGRDWGMDFGAIVGQVELIDICRTEEILPQLSSEEVSYGDYTSGRYAWQLATPVRFERAVPYRGWQKLFEVDESYAGWGAVVPTLRLSSTQQRALNKMCEP